MAGDIKNSILLSLLLLISDTHIAPETPDQTLQLRLGLSDGLQQTIQGTLVMCKIFVWKHNGLMKILLFGLLDGDSLPNLELQFALPSAPTLL